jgi:hypothetical protein
MKKICLFIVFTTIIFNSLADGWRNKEKQVLLLNVNKEQFGKIMEMKLNFDLVSPNTLRAYVIPKELDILKAKGFELKVEIDDLNNEFQDFWAAKDAYHSYQEIIDLADSLELHFPTICKKFIFGTSLGGRQLAALKISDNVHVDESEAEVMFDGGIHGDEIGCSENVIRFARDLCLDYGFDPAITDLIDNREIWLYLMVNPDGRVNMSRYNNNGVDLNRDWAYMWDSWGGSTGPCSQVESKALRDCMYHNQFVVHTTFHSGTEFISYPWSYRPDSPNDLAHINQLAGLYSSTSGYSNLPYGSGYSGMYAINGSTKDSNYGIMGSVSWSLEISFSKQPPASQIMMYYNYNKPAMLMLIEYAGYGLQGTVTDAITGDSLAAIVFVENYFPTYTDPVNGDFHKYVLPGTYNITVMANGYQSQTIENVVVTEMSITTTNFQLQPEEGHFVYKFYASQIPDNNHADEGWTPGVLGTPDNINYSIGKSGWVVLDMQTPVSDGPGMDITVYEGDSSPEGFTCYLAGTMDGPWINIGSGNGTTSFDIAASGLAAAQFIKLIDDGDGVANTDNAGFDLDAVGAIEPVSGVYLALYEYQINDSYGNNDGILDPGETADIIVTLINNGNLMAENVLGVISTPSPFINILEGEDGFGSLEQYQLGQGIFTINANTNTPQGEPINLNLNVEANSGLYSNLFNIDFVVGQIAIAVIDLDDNTNSGPDMVYAIGENGLQVEYFTEFPADLSNYSTLFVCLGIYSNNHILSSLQGQMLADFLNQGGNLYMEGGDTWAYDSQTNVHSMFNIVGQSDGSGDLNNIVGQSGTLTEGMLFDYSGENNWIDRLVANNPAFIIFRNDNPTYGTGIAYDAGTYKTIGVSHEFGGLTDGSSPSTKVVLMEQYLDFFGLIPEPFQGIEVQIKLFLEGPFVSNEMITNLNVLGMIPLNQPYNVSPWNYNGSESVIAIPNSDIVDWIFVELRETPGGASTATPATLIAQQAGFVLKNGYIVSVDGYSIMVFDVLPTQNIFAVVYHRNHLGIQSAAPMNQLGNVYNFDFTAGENQVYGLGHAHKQLAVDVWGMVVGDANADGEIDNKDKNDYWETQLSGNGYYLGDFDMDGVVDMDDKNNKWEINSGKCSFVVK